jgi:hypothetical protein
MHKNKITIFAKNFPTQTTFPLHIKRNAVSVCISSSRTNTLPRPIEAVNSNKIQINIAPIPAEPFSGSVNKSTFGNGLPSNFLNNSSHSRTEKILPSASLFMEMPSNKSEQSTKRITDDKAMRVRHSISISRRNTAHTCTHQIFTLFMLLFKMQLPSAERGLFGVVCRQQHQAPLLPMRQDNLADNRHSTCV